MSELKIRDFYGQCLTISNETRSGNIRLITRTCEDLNEAQDTQEADMPITTDLSLDRDRVMLIIAALKHMLSDDEIIS